MRRIVGVNEEGFTSRYVSEAVKNELTPRQRELVYMYYIRQMRMSDAARQLGISTQSVSRTLQRARSRLEHCLKYSLMALREREE